METRKMEIPENAARLFELLARDSGNWGGMPLFNGNVQLLGEREDRGLLTHLKRAGLVTTQTDEGCTWVLFTAAGVERAAALGVRIEGGAR